MEVERIFNEKRFDFYLKLYEDEINMKDSINNRAGLVFGLLQLLIPAFVLLWMDSIEVSKKIIWISMLSIESMIMSYIDYFVYIYRGVLILFLLGIIFSSFCAMRIMFRYKYSYFPKFSQLLEHEVTLQAHYKNNEPYYMEQRIDSEIFFQKEMEKFLVEKIEEAMMINQNSNEQKLKWMKWTFISVVSTLIIGLICLVFFMIGNCI